MTRLAYLDAFSGLAGDMFVGALLDCGLELDALRAELAKLPLAGYSVRREVREKSGIRGTKFVVDLGGAHAHTHGGGEHDHHHGHGHGEEHPHPHRSEDAGGAHGHRPYREIRRLLEDSGLSPRVLERALAIFTKLAAAEGKVHGLPPDDVQFHEVGAIDSIVDVVGAAWAVDALGIDELTVGTLPLGKGFVRSGHGPLPVPGPATIEMLRGFPVRLQDGEWEMVTPTGAAIVAALARPAAMPPVMVVERIGYGAGDSDFRDRPNLLRVMLGAPTTAVGADALLLLETNLDDLNPEIYEHVMERLFAEGARDVFFAPIHMKKNRPAVLLSVLADPVRRDGLAAVLFAETSTLGVRVTPVERLRIEREQRAVETRYGTIRVKVGRGPGGTFNVAPEYEDCKRAAAAASVPLKTVYQEAAAAALASERS